jgi:hypothetical protein
MNSENVGSIHLVNASWKYTDKHLYRTVTPYNSFVEPHHFDVIPAQDGENDVTPGSGSISCVLSFRKHLKHHFNAPAAALKHRCRVALNWPGGKNCRKLMDKSGGLTVLPTHGKCFLPDQPKNSAAGEKIRPHNIFSIKGWFNWRKQWFNDAH